VLEERRFAETTQALKMYPKSQTVIDSFKWCWFQASAAKQLRTALFWFITQPVVVISYRRFGTNYRFKT